MPAPNDMPRASRIFDGAVTRLGEARDLPARPSATIETHPDGTQQLLLNGRPLPFEIEPGIDVTPIDTATSLVTISIPCEFAVRFRTLNDD